VNDGVSAADVKAFAALFRGRTDAYGGVGDYAVHQPLTHSVYARHLSGREPIGVYVLCDGDGVYWCVIDYDDKQNRKGELTRRQHVADIANALSAAGAYPHVEQSRSGRGFHIWLFFQDAIPARLARQLCNDALNKAGLHNVEVFPKQDSRDELDKGLGNFVHAPYGGHAVCVDTRRRVMLDEDFKPLTLSDFLAAVPLHGHREVCCLCAFWWRYGDV
jgi:hypothetical protein